MGNFFFNKDLNANNVIDIGFDIEKLKELEIIKKSYLWGTNKDIFPPQEFSSIKPAWGGDMEWISSNNMNTYNLFLKGFETLGLEKILKDIIEYDTKLRLYAGFFLKRSTSKKNFHVDWQGNLKNNAFTLLTPLYQEEDALHLLYKDISGKECKYKYEIGKGILFGSDFNHSTQPGESSSPSILLCFQFGTDLAEYNQGVHNAMGAQTPFMLLPDGRCMTHEKVTPKITTNSEPIVEKWDFLLSKFRSLGGIAENICQKEGKLGRGIFSVNSNLRSRIYIPSKLMINKEDIYLEDNKLRIKQSNYYSNEHRDFFNYYQDNFSWGFGGKETTECFEKGLSLFSIKLNELIAKNILIDIKERHIGNWKNIILREFLNARSFQFNKQSMICPILELVNHEVISLPFISSSNGISTPNYPPIDGEITHNYNNKSSLNRFFHQGCFCKETIVYSFPFSINLNKHGISFICKGKELNDHTIKIDRFKNTITIEGLPIADINQYKLPSNYFDEIIRRTSDLNIPKEIFFKILDFNISVRKNMLKESQLINNKVSNMFSEIINHEINLISSCN
tara:strand:- start:895 stop:2589 length:1695 start_codon:yes stop_codon:yes gene_type:complete